jgi:hypothetical protein
MKRSIVEDFPEQESALVPKSRGVMSKASG